MARRLLWRPAGGGPCCACAVSKRGTDYQGKIAFSEHRDDRCWCFLTNPHPHPAPTNPCHHSSLGHPTIMLR